MGQFVPTAAEHQTTIQKIQVWCGAASAPFELQALRLDLDVYFAHTEMTAWSLPATESILWLVCGRCETEGTQ